MSISPGQFSIDDVLSVIDVISYSIFYSLQILNCPVDTVQTSIADKWLQEWQNTGDCWITCIAILEREQSQHYSIFAINSLIRYILKISLIISFLHQHFFSLTSDSKRDLTHSLVSLISVTSTSLFIIFI